MGPCFIVPNIGNCFPRNPVFITNRS